MHNLTKIYSDFLDLFGMSEEERGNSLRRIFTRDIEENEYFIFREKRVRPIRGEKPEMQIMFTHLTTHSLELKDANGRIYKKREYENARSIRLHWICTHLTGNIEGLEVFSVEHERRVRTYIYNRGQKYVIVLEPYRKENDYYLITAYYLESRGVQKIENTLKRKLPEIH